MRRTACSKQKSKEETVSTRHVARYGDRRGEVAARGDFLFYFINIYIYIIELKLDFNKHGRRYRNARLETMKGDGF